MVMPKRTYSAGRSYRYGFNGQEKEVGINENISNALYWEYDSRIGRRWNVDPLDYLLPQSSPYSCFMDSPVSKIDPTGATADPTIDKKNKTITYKANIILYGNLSARKMNRMLSKVTKQTDNLNTQNFKADYEGDVYSVKFEVATTSVTETEAMEMAKNNKSLKNNFIRVEESSRTSFMLGLGGNSGVFTTADFMGKKSNSTTAIHELFHSLGVDHPPTFPAARNTLTTIWFQKELRMADPRGSWLRTRARDFMVKDPNLPTFHFRYYQLNPDERMVKPVDIQEAVNAIHCQRAINKIYKNYNETY
jgi:hypothetical protein